MKKVFVVIRTEGEYESRDFPVRAFASNQAATAFAQDCTDTFKRQHGLFAANRDRHGDKWWEFGYEKTDAIEARYERKLADRGCSIKDSDVWWGVWEIPFSSGKRHD